MNLGVFQDAVKVLMICVWAQFVNLTNTVRIRKTLFLMFWHKEIWFWRVLCGTMLQQEQEWLLFFEPKYHQLCALKSTTKNESYCIQFSQQLCPERMQIYLCQLPKSTRRRNKSSDSVLNFAVEATSCTEMAWPDNTEYLVDGLVRWKRTVKDRKLSLEALRYIVAATTGLYHCRHELMHTTSRMNGTVFMFVWSCESIEPTLSDRP